MPGTFYVPIIILINLIWLSSSSRKKSAFWNHQKPFLWDSCVNGYEDSRPDSRTHHLSRRAIGISGSLPPRDLSTTHERTRYPTARPNDNKDPNLLFQSKPWQVFLRIWSRTSGLSSNHGLLVIRSSAAMMTWLKQRSNSCIRISSAKDWSDVFLNNDQT